MLVIGTCMAVHAFFLVLPGTCPKACHGMLHQPGSVAAVASSLQYAVACALFALPFAPFQALADLVCLIWFQVHNPICIFLPTACVHHISSECEVWQVLPGWQHAQPLMHACSYTLHVQLYTVSAGLRGCSTVTLVLQALTQQAHGFSRLSPLHHAAYVCAYVVLQAAAAHTYAAYIRASVRTAATTRDAILRL